MDKIKDRLSTLIDKETNGKHTVFAKKAGIPPSTFQAYLKGRPPHVEHVVRMHHTFSVNINWLLLGIGKMYTEKPPGSSYDISDKANTAEDICEAKDGIQTPLLQLIIQCVEQVIAQDKNLGLSPEKKAEAIAVLYELFINSKKEVALSVVRRCMKLIAA